VTELVDVRPGGLDALFRQGDPFTLTLTWPSGELAGRSFTAALDAAPLSVDVVGDVMTVTVSAAQSAAAAQRGTFVLTDTTGGGSLDLIVGRWSPSLNPAAQVSDSVEVATAEATATVAVAAAPATPAVVHDWTQDGWTPWVTQLVNNGDAGGTIADQALSVVGSRGRITNTDTDGNVRVAYERLGTDWLDSEILCLWNGASVFDSAGVATPQMGQFHRGYLDDDGVWRAVVISNNIFLTDVNVVNQNVWNHDPTEADGQAQLDLGTNGGSKTYSNAALRRHLALRARSRFDFGGWTNQFQVEPLHLYGLTASIPVTVDSNDATFDQVTAAAPISVDNATGIVNMSEPTTLSAVSLTVDNGNIVPSTESARRWWPYWVRSQLIGRKLRVKVWRYMDPEPDWADTNHVVEQDFARTTGLGGGVAGIPEPGALMPETVGRCGVIGAHIKNSAYIEYGHFEARQL